MIGHLFLQFSGLEMITSLLSFVVVLVSWMGHAAWLVIILNCLYGYALPRRFLRILRRLVELLILASPVLFWFAYGFDRSWAPNVLPGETVRSVLALYGLFCGFLSLGVFPVITLCRLLRRPPAALAGNHNQIIDVAQQLGCPPIGRGKYRHLARLPYNQLFQVDFAERTLCLPQLPDHLNGLTILHLSDLHFIGTPDRVFFQHVMDQCRDWEPDLVALTGDVVDSLYHHRWIVPVLGRLKWRVAAFAVLGNHDYWQDPSLVRRRLRRAGMRVLGNAWEQLEVNGKKMVVIGHEGPWFRPEPDLSACPAGVFRLCLSHTPDNIRWARRHGVDLMLAGHNHGGQVRFPVIGSVFVPSRYSRRYDCGTFHEPPTVLHVSRGLAGQHPLRYNCRPEVTLIRLHSSGSKPGREPC